MRIRCRILGHFVIVTILSFLFLLHITDWGRYIGNKNVLRETFITYRTQRNTTKKDSESSTINNVKNKDFATQLSVNLRNISHDWRKAAKMFNQYDDTSRRNINILRETFIMYRTQRNTTKKYAESSTITSMKNKDFAQQLSVNLRNIPHDWRKAAKMFNQNHDTSRRYLTIGIPTVKREKGYYLMDTIKSIVDCSSLSEMKEIYIVIFLADFDGKWKSDVSNQINLTYSQLIMDGTIQVIQSWEAFYPPLENISEVFTYVDPYKKIKWRAKQNVDYAFLFLYSQHLSTYYMQLEDDVFTKPRYLQTVKDYMMNITSRWTCLEFSELGFIGKLYHSYDLERLATMVLLFYEGQPCDITYLNFNNQMLQFQRYICKPSIFQHVGQYSSLSGKEQPLKDRYFEAGSNKTYKGDNPPAQIFTNMPINDFFAPQKAYKQNGFFWSEGPGKRNAWFIIVFEKPQHIDKVIITTGVKDYPRDIIHSGKLQASLQVDRSLKIPKCTTDKYLAHFVGGKIEVSDVAFKANSNAINCLKVTLLNYQRNWVIIYEIAVFLKKK